MYLRILILIICILLSSSSVELISVRQEVRTLGQRLHLLERKQMLDSGQYQAQIGHVLDMLHGLNSSGITYAGGNDGETTTTDRLEQDIQAKVNATEQRLELFEHTTNKQMQAVLRGIRNEKVLRKRSAERVMDQLDNHIQKLVTTMTDRFDKQDAAIMELTKQGNVCSDRIETVHTTVTDRFDKQDAANRELMKQGNVVSDRIETVHRNLKDDIADMNDTLRHGNQCVLDNAVMLKTIENTANASQYHSNDIRETLKTIECSVINLIETNPKTTPKTCPPDWTLFPSTHSCYKFFPARVSFDDAVQNCIDVNSHLTDITSDLEYEFVGSLIDGPYTYSLIGLTDEKTEGDWRWKHNNHAASYVNWYPGRPNGGTHNNCAYIWYENTKWYMYDQTCSGWFQYICKMVLSQTC